MKKRIGSILIIVFIIVGCDWLVGAVTGKMIRNVRDVGVNQTNTAQALFSRKADVLILHHVPTIRLTVVSLKTLLV